MLSSSGSFSATCAVELASDGGALFSCAGVDELSALFKFCAIEEIAESICGLEKISFRAVESFSLSCVFFAASLI